MRRRRGTERVEEEEDLVCFVFSSLLFVLVLAIPFFGGEELELVCQNTAWARW